MCIFCLCDLKISHQYYLMLSVYFLYKSIRCKIINLTPDEAILCIPRIV